MFCETDIYHPNIDTTEMEYDSSGTNVCLNLLDSGTWSRKFGLEGAILGIIFLLHNPNLSDPLAPDIDRDEETFEENVKKYMRGESVEGRTFTADFLKDLQARDATKDDSVDKVDETGTSVDKTEDENTSNVHSDPGANNSNADSAENTISDIKDTETLLGELKQLGIDENETVNENDEDACTLVALDDDTVLVPFESTDIIQEIENAAEGDDIATTDDDINNNAMSTVNSIVTELVENAMNVGNTCNIEDCGANAAAMASSKESDSINVNGEIVKMTVGGANAATNINTQEYGPLVRTEPQNVVSEEVTLQNPSFSRQKSKEYVNSDGRLFHACVPYIKCVVLHTFRCLTRL